ncbi:MAG: hypothetical protein S0880_18720 [Actinomycetota bacterium]|nr:hypothetical protein [Actinomycetota bacterium]
MTTTTDRAATTHRPEPAPQGARAWAGTTDAITLAEGAFAFDTDDGRHVIATPAGEFLELRLAAAAWARLRVVLDGRPPAEALGGVHDGEAVAVGAALDVLAAEGVLAPLAPPPRLTGHVVVTGDGPVAEHLVELTGEAGLASTRCDGDAVGAALDDADVAVDVVVACEGWLPDTRWRALDAVCVNAGVPWHRCWREGATAWLGPLTVPGRSASYDDLRLRRLAASSWPAELIASWGRMEDADVPAAVWPPAVCAMIAGALVADVLALLDTARDPDPSAMAVATAWRGYDLGSSWWQRHPVLALPAGILHVGEDFGDVTVEAAGRR